MTAADGPAAPGAPRRRRAGWVARLAASRGFQRWAAATPLVRRIARRDGEALMDLVAGFVHSQVLRAVVDLDLVERLLDAPADTDALARACALPPERMAVLLDAAAASGLVRRDRRGQWHAGRRGAALATVPGLRAIVQHHDALYDDLRDPVALLRGEGETHLSRFWPYVFGAARAEDPAAARRYSDLMAQSQILVAEETLARIDLSGVDELLDVGGGTGAFLEAVGGRHPRPRLHLFDLPAVVPDAERRFARAGLSGRTRITPGSFRDRALPEGAEAISLVRVLYDHEDDTAMALLRAARAALPPGGRLVISEPMAGSRAGDGYFALYTLAMRTGRARHPRALLAMMEAAGFRDLRDHGTTRPFVTRVLSGRSVRPD